MSSVSIGPIDYADFHCDTLTNRRKSVNSLSELLGFRNVIQYYAIFTPSRVGNTFGWKNFLAVADTYLTTSFPANMQSYLTVEDCRIFDNDVNRLKIAYNKGVRILTPFWRDTNFLGGAHNTSVGLTRHGKEFLRISARMGFILDVSHASRMSAEQILDIGEEMKTPVCATHSDAYSVQPHTRNMPDSLFLRICRSDSLCGINLYPPFLTSAAVADIRNILNHIEHFMSLGGENHICLGCDFDGIDLFPQSINSVSDMPRLYEALLSAGYPENTVKNIFYGNLHRFTDKYINKISK